MWPGSDPVAIPAGADALVTISATNEDKITHCRPQIKDLIPLEFFKSFTPTEAIASSEIFVQQTRASGCDMPVLMHLPKPNDTLLPPCWPAILYIVKTIGAMQQEYNADEVDSTYYVSKHGL